MKMNINKSIGVLGITVALSLLTPGCKKALDVLPFSSFTDATAFTSQERVEAAINGVYDAAQSGFYAGGAVRGYPFGAANITQGDMRGEDMLNNALFYQVTYEATYNPTSANQDFMFQTLYALINKANLTIEGVQGAITNNIVTAEIGNAYIGEARFLRALAHHELVVNFARPYRDGNGSQMGIIYREKGINGQAAIEEARAQTRTSVGDNYAKILDDLNFAETNLPETQTGANKTYRASKAAAIALKSRIYLHMGDWPKVVEEGNKLVPATAPFQSAIGGWRLEADPATPFTTGGWQGNESIFSVRNASTDNPGVNGALGNMLGTTATGGRALVRISPILYNLPEWLCTDRRRNMMITITEGTKVNYLSNKYKDPTTSTDPAPQIRYAEVLLNLAEAESRIGGGVSERGLALLNAVRNRSVDADAQFGIGDFANKNELISAILVERRIEFAAEGKRWMDIHRNAVDPDFSIGGIPAKIGTGVAGTSFYECGAGSTPYTTAVAALPYSDHRFIWPIPLSELQSNKNYEQNPVY
ncbi:RagB/SusD family nutrient uptake outer membrane protein [Flavihumibacter sp. UBA7668]|uniref:RagB/SusD family nutrient uptake outer membrane protein n=1 Tax=Flavihumibacter sp. UBA7668 TaxID=1946542 RepID=UPI0025BCDA90|nr:RagB/SusD family nutrient uptake outer membrane protein [Flavihumibacter sp. UBA7668]